MTYFLFKGELTIKLWVRPLPCGCRQSLLSEHNMTACTIGGAITVLLSQVSREGQDLHRTGNHNRESLKNKLKAYQVKNLSFTDKMKCKEYLIFTSLD